MRRGLSPFVFVRSVRSSETIDLQIANRYDDRTLGRSGRKKSSFRRTVKEKTRERYFHGFCGGGVARPELNASPAIFSEVSQSIWAGS